MDTAVAVFWIFVLGLLIWAMFDPRLTRETQRIPVDKSKELQNLRIELLQLEIKKLKSK